MRRTGQVATVALALLVAGCTRSAGWVDDAEEAHRAADAALARGDAEGALSALEHFVAQPVPRTIARPDQRVVLQDALYRIAELQTLHDAKGALASAERGLGLGQEPDVFTANLWISKGHSLEALGNDKEAARAYAEAQRIDAALLEQVTR